MGAPVVAVAGVLISLFLCIIGAGATKTVIFSGGIHHGRTQVGVGETIVVKMSSLKTTGSLPVLDTGIFSFPGSSSDNIFEVSFTQLSYLHSDNCSLRIYNGASSSGTRILAHYEKKNQRLMRVLSSTNTIYVEMRVSALSRGKQDFDITMKLYPLKESTTDFYTEQYSTIQGLYVNDGKTRTAIAGSELAYDSGNVYVFNSIEYRAAGAGNNPTARQFRVTFSSESYIKTSGIVVVIRDGPSDSSKSLGYYNSSMPFPNSTLVTTQKSLYVMVSGHPVVGIGNYYVRMFITPQGDGSPLSTLEIGITAGVCIFVVFAIAGVVAGIVIRRRRRLRNMAYGHLNS